MGSTHWYDLGGKCVASSNLAHMIDDLRACLSPLTISAIAVFYIELVKNIQRECRSKVFDPWVHRERGQVGI